MFHILWKELKLFFADKRALIMTFILPIALISLFALAFGGAGKGEGPHRYPLPIVDLDQTSASRGLVDSLSSGKNLDVSLLSLEEGKNAIKKGKESAVLILHHGLADSLEKKAAPPLELMIDEAKAPEAGLLTQVLASQLFRMTSQAEMKSRIHAQIDEKYGRLSKALLDSIHKQIDESAGNSSSESTGLKITRLIAAKADNTVGIVQAVAGTAIMMLLFSVTAMGASLITEREEGTLKKLLTSPVHPNGILFGKMLTSSIVSVIQLSIMMVYAWGVFGLNLFQNIPALILLILATAYACASVGMLLSSIAKTRPQVQAFSTLIILSMSALGGSMVPSFLMPEWMQKLSVFSVNYWSIQGFFDVFWRQLPLTDLTFLKRILVLIAIGTVMSVISLRLFQRNLRRMY